MAERITIARPYAKAVFQLANAGGRLAPWSQSLAAAAAVVLDARVAALIGSPAVTPAQLAELVGGVAASAVGEAAFDEQARNFIATLAVNRRLDLLPEIAARYEQLKAEAERVIDVTVTSATALSEAQRKAIAAALGKRLAREVRLHCELDPALIGGAVVRAGDLVIDGSVKAGLAQLAATTAA